jgi:UDP-N-acetylglucosamine acyltransferase
MKIHPSTIIEGQLEADEGVEIGPYCFIQGNVKIGKGTRVEGHVTIGSRHGEIEIGERNHFSPGAVIGGPPQDVSYKNEVTRLKIGNDNVFREFTTANLATLKADRETTIGNNCYFMSYTHIGHDSKIGNNVVIANDSHLGGHTTVEDGVTIGGACAFNQFTRVGRLSFIAGGSIVNKDILPYTRAHGDHAVSRATNKIGLQRKGLSKEEVENIHKAVRILIMGSETLEEAIVRIKNECQITENIQYLFDFIQNSKRGIAR